MTHHHVLPIPTETAKERPILFSAPMIRALLDGTKSQTRRVVKKPGCQCGTWIPKEMDATTPEGFQTIGHSGRWWCECCTSDQDAVNCPYGQPGDRLWVKETFFIDHFEYYPSGPLPKQRPDLSDGMLLYRANGSCCDQLGECECGGKGAIWRPSIFMPRWASRISLEVASVRVERVQEISETDALAEGINFLEMNDGRRVYHTADPDALSTDPRVGYRALWESINGPGSWATNSWVWVLSFHRVAP